MVLTLNLSGLFGMAVALRLVPAFLQNEIPFLSIKTITYAFCGVLINRVYGLFWLILGVHLLTFEAC